MPRDVDYAPAQTNVIASRLSGVAIYQAAMAHSGKRHFCFKVQVINHSRLQTVREIKGV